MLTKFLVEPVLLGGLLPATLQYRMLVKNKYLGLVYVFLKKNYFRPICRGSTYCYPEII